MFTCRQIPDVASDYIDREGSKGTLVSVALHLATCRACRSYVRGLKTTRSITAMSLAGPVPDALLVTLGLKDPDRDASHKEPNE